MKKLKVLKRDRDDRIVKTEREYAMHGKTAGRSDVMRTIKEGTDHVARIAHHRPRI